MLSQQCFHFGSGTQPTYEFMNITNLVGEGYQVQISQQMRTVIWLPSRSMLGFGFQVATPGISHI